MRHLAGHHVHFVGQGDGDQHIGFRGARPLQHIRVRGVPDEGLDVQRIVDLADQFRRLIDHGNIVIFL